MIRTPHATPPIHAARIAASLELSQKSVGSRVQAEPPRISDARPRNAPSGRIPWAPIRPEAWTPNERKAIR